MKEWLTARELSSEGLSDLPTTESAMIRAAARDGWNDCIPYCRNRKGRGGGLEYHINLLPTSARLEYERRYRQIVALPAPVEPELVLGSDLTERAARERDARLAIVGTFDVFAAGQTLGAASCIQIFVNRYNMRSMPVEKWITDLIPRLSKRTLARWRAAKFLGRVDRLAVDRSLARKGKGVLETANDGKVRTFILALIAHQPLLSAAQVRTQVRAEFGDELVNHFGELVEMPPVRTFQHVLKVLKTAEKVILAKLSDPDHYRSTMAPSGVGTYRWVTEPNMLWMIDASPVDALCVDGRHAIYACIDIATRRTILYCSRTPRASAVAMLMRKAIASWGVPKTIKTDNGSDFVAIATKRLFESLHIEPDVSDAYSPQQKGHVERVIKTFQHDCGTLLPGFVGHSVTDRKRIEDRKGFADRLGQDTAEAFGVSLTGPQLQEYVDRWIDMIYQHHGHAGLDGATPAQVAARSTTPIRTVDERALDILLMPLAGRDGIRTVTKFGIRAADHHYVINEALPGDRVLVRMDPMDAGRVYAFDADDGRFVGEGICPDLRGISAATLLAAKRELTSERLAEATREVRKDIKRITKGPNLLDRALTVAARDIPNVIALPKRTEAHETPAIAAALDVDRRSARATERQPLSERAAALHAEMTRAAPIAPEARASVVPLRAQETKQQRFRRALDLEARREAGDPLAEEEAFWLGNYSAGAEYRAMCTVYADGGEKVLR